MNEKTRAFLIPLVIGAVLTIAVCLLTYSANTGLVQLLCDGFFVSGVLIAGSGGLLFARNEGLFDIFGFGVKSLLGIHLPWTAPKKDNAENFAEYRQRKRESRKSPAGILFAGVVYLALALIMLVIYLCL